MTTRNTEDEIDALRRADYSDNERLISAVLGIGEELVRVLERIARCLEDQEDRR